ncbi:MAG: RNA polymerase sigma factor [Armatimonadetes bacterium]|nr:RNA polymerase sigma factor [Armatimonadota bacterium]
MNPPSLESMVAEHYDSVWRFCARRCGQDLAPDLTQETFITAQKALKGFRGESSVKTWLLGIALNHCRVTSRKLGREILSDAVLLEGSTAPNDDILNRVFLEEVLLNLPIEQREVVVLHELEGLTYEEIAHLTNVPVGTVKSRLHYAFVQLRKSVEPDLEVNL